MKNKTREDYLRAIFLIYETQTRNLAGVKSVDIAKSLAVSKPSVSSMVSKLSKEGLVRAHPYGLVFLTKKGISEAKKITKKHRVIEVFLTDILGYAINEAEDEAHRLEHAFSDESIKRLSKFLNNPRRCPHGNRIYS
ncbi:MAG: metal-dependent transcriptional regulator [archaeon]